MNPVNIVVLISGSGTNLQAIIDAVERGEINGRIAAVISNRPDAKGLERAQQHGLHTVVIDHRTFSGRDTFDAALQATIEQFQPALVVLAGFMRILTDGFVQHFSGRLLNIHPSLLPKFKGLNTHARALEAGEKEHGCSVHFVSCELDGGAVIGQARVAIAADDSADTLATKVQQLEHRLYPTCVKLFCAGQLQLTDNGALLDGKPLPLNGLDLTEAP
ncbi:MAG: phosphoribosylglycinamide formyltransferase [Gammaproteobacteria bacterium]|nr:phosphoribosylglycinamide formyltransferase [Gammaproteobacteria bacterium]